MRTHSPLNIVILDLLEGHGLRRSVSFSACVEGLETGLSHVDPSDELAFDLVIESIEGGLHVRGTVAGRYAAQCRRCLEPIARDFTFETSEIYRPPSEVWEEDYVIRTDHIDLAPLVRDAVILNLPVNPLCKEDCAGLCPRCGADRNADPCDCPTDAADPRWSALKDLRGAWGAE